MAFVKYLMPVAFLGFVLGATPAIPQSIPSKAKTSVPAASVSTAPQADAGARAFLQCRSCHTLKRGQADLVGPNLYGFMGTRAGTHRPRFAYSSAAKNSNLVWTDASLDRWLENPAATIPGTTMAFAGIRRAETRAALIAYLKRETQ
jgi:cytochrome c